MPLSVDEEMRSNRSEAAGEQQDIDIDDAVIISDGKESAVEPLYENRGHDWIADRYFTFLETSGRAPTPSAFGTDTNTGNSDSSGENEPERADVGVVLRHVIYRVLRTIIFTNSRPSDWYQAAQAGARWVCPLEGCMHEVNPLWLDADARDAVATVFGELGLTTERWTGHSVLATEAEYELDTDRCRLKMLPEEMSYRRMAMDVIGWNHIQLAHLGKYGVTILNTGVLDPPGGLNGVSFVMAETNRLLAAYAPGLGFQDTDEHHRLVLEGIRTQELQRLDAECHRVRIVLTRWHRRQERFLERSVIFGDNLPVSGREPSAYAGRVAMLGLERFRERFEPSWAPRRLQELEENIESWRVWDLLSCPVPDVL